MKKGLAVLSLGWLSVSTAIVAQIRAGAGLAPYDVLNTAVARQLSIQPGTASWLMCAVFVSLAWILGVKPGLGTLAGAFVVGGLINAGLSLTADPHGLVLRSVIFAASLAVLYFGICCIILSDAGSGPTELVTLGLVNQRFSLRSARWIVEGVCLCIGAVLGGALGVGTLCVVLVSGPALSFLLPRVKTLLRID